MHQVSVLPDPPAGPREADEVVGIVVRRVPIRGGRVEVTEGRVLPKLGGVERDVLERPVRAPAAAGHRLDDDVHVRRLPPPELGADRVGRDARRVARAGGVLGVQAAPVRADLDPLGRELAGGEVDGADDRAAHAAPPRVQKNHPELHRGLRGDLAAAPLATVLGDTDACRRVEHVPAGGGRLHLGLPCAAAAVEPRPVRRQ
mmetsp:Transcript_3865/g.8631  ORF Transcript_3865/g.8631 Transcript_3865/m.8631 type:complete len:202 (+) Transcript_3865:816-1421(+)